MVKAQLLVRLYPPLNLKDQDANAAKAPVEPLRDLRPRWFEVMTAHSALT